MATALVTGVIVEMVMVMVMVVVVVMVVPAWPDVLLEAHETN